jgi:hypothetical protein
MDAMDVLCNIRRIIAPKRPEDVHYILHNDNEYTFDEYEALLLTLNLEEDSWLTIVNFLAEDKIVGDWWWFEFTAVCCGDPYWYYREHPSVKRVDV